MPDQTALFTNDAVVLGILAGLLGLVFWTSSLATPFWQRFYRFVPALLLCYFLPGVLNSLGIIDGDSSQLYFVASRYLLPAALILLTLSIDIPAIIRLGPKALIMFGTGTLGILIGGPVALTAGIALFPDALVAEGSEATWRGMTTVAGSWIGGGANQAAMKEVFEVGDDVFAQMIAVDVIVANVWMAVLLFMAGRAAAIDRWNGADASAIEDIKQRVEAIQAKHARIPSLNDLMIIVAIAFVGTGLAHLAGDNLAPFLAREAPYLQTFSLTSGFFWIVVVATSVGLILSLTPLSRFERAGASRLGSVFVYVLVATIGMKMDIRALADAPALFVIGFIWIGIHAALLLVVGYLINAPVFFLAVGSQANVGGAASAPVVASAFHPSLAPVGVLLAVFGYALGTYAAWICGQMLRLVAA